MLPLLYMEQSGYTVHTKVKAKHIFCQDSAMVHMTWINRMRRYDITLTHFPLFLLSSVSLSTSNGCVCFISNSLCPSVDTSVSLLCLLPCLSLTFSLAGSSVSLPLSSTVFLSVSLGGFLLSLLLYSSIVLSSTAVFTSLSSVSILRFSSG